MSVRGIVRHAGRSARASPLVPVAVLGELEVPALPLHPAAT